jgi:hypothetical protein
MLEVCQEARKGKGREPAEGVGMKGQLEGVGGEVAQIGWTVRILERHSYRKRESNHASVC